MLFGILLVKYFWGKNLSATIWQYARQIRTCVFIGFALVSSGGPRFSLPDPASIQVSPRLTAGDLEHGVLCSYGFQGALLTLDISGCPSLPPHWCCLSAVAASGYDRANQATLVNTQLKLRKKTNPCPCYTHFLGYEQKGSPTTLAKLLSPWLTHSFHFGPLFCDQCTYLISESEEGED